jgi:hypothetical protein
VNAPILEAVEQTERHGADARLADA